MAPSETDLRCSEKSIEAAYGVTKADGAVVADEKLLRSYDIVANLKEGGSLIVQTSEWKDESVTDKIGTALRKTLAGKKANLFVLYPGMSATVAEDPTLGPYLLQLAFLKIARPELYEKGLQKLLEAEDSLNKLASDLETSLRSVEVPESWLTVEAEENVTLPLPDRSKHQ